MFPELVSHHRIDASEKDLYTMNYSALGVLAIKAIQEQQQQLLKEHNIVEEMKKAATKQEAILGQQTATIAQQQKQIEALRATVQEVSDQMKLKKSAPRVAAANE